MTLEELKALLNTNGEYAVLAHGTNLTIDEIQEKIFYLCQKLILIN